VRSGKPQVNQNFLTDPRMAPWRATAVRLGYQSSMAAPLKDDSGVFATLSVYASESDAFDTEELGLITELAEDLSFGLASLLAQKFAEEHAALKGEEPREKSDALAVLSTREREVMKLVVEGRSSKEIARALGIAPASVFTYRSRIMFKLGIEDITGLVRFAIRHGLIEP
jgi:DNA-binding NarL/FixJ family response regulator